MLFYIKWIDRTDLAKDFSCEVIGNEQSVVCLGRRLEEQKKDFRIGLIGQNPCGQSDLGWSDFKHWK